MTPGTGPNPVSTFANYEELSTFAVHFCSLQPSTFENVTTGVRPQVLCLRTGFDYPSVSSAAIRAAIAYGAELRAL